MSLTTILVFFFQAGLVFIASSFIFDVVQCLLHYWQESRFKLLRTFSEMHDSHHKFLDANVTINSEYTQENFWYHLVPEFLVTLLGCSLLFFIFPWEPVAATLVLHVVLFIGRIYGKGIDINHKTLNRLKGQRGVFHITPSYHALHHIYPLQYFSSMANIFDLIFATSCPIKSRRFLVTGANGVYGKAMVKRLKKMGAQVEVATYGVDYTHDDYTLLDAKLQQADVLILAHGTKLEQCMEANHDSFVAFIERFIELGKDRLIPPEVWAVGSEAEFHGDMGLQSLKAYSQSKRAFAAKAKGYFLSNDVTYKHIVPSAFTSPMGPGLMTGNFAVSYSLFFIRRGFNYIPVTYTGLAFLNYFRFRFFQKMASADEPSNIGEGVG